MKKLTYKLGLIAIISFILAACTNVTEPSEAYSGETPQQIFSAGKTALQGKSFGEAVKRFEALDVQYPFNEETESAQLYLIYAYYMKEEYPLALVTAERFIQMHPVNPNVDYAYYMRGLSSFYQNMGVLEKLFAVDLATRDLTQIQKSYYYFRDLVTRFPHSRYAPAAHQYLVYLRNVLADHQLHIAEFYYQRQAYLASANRASELVAHYQGAPAVVYGLELMAKSYHQLGLKKEEQETLLVLKYNYPNRTVILH